jgi:nitrite reductase/ring-hydroxylating ferredoxin subunit
MYIINWKTPVSLISIEYPFSFMTYTKVAKTSDIQPGTIKGFVVDGKKIAIANPDGKFYAIEDSCPHQHQPLSAGMMMGNVVMCLFHGYRVDLATGESLNTANERVKTYPVKVEGDDVLVDL